MGAQDREDHTQDVEMEGNSDTVNKAKQQDIGQRNQQPIPPLSQTVDDSSMDTDPSHEITSTSSTAATSVMAEQPPARAAPSIDEQVDTVTRMIEKPVQDKQKGYVVSSKWLNRVLARSHNDARGISADKFATEGEIGPVDSTDLVLITDDTNTLSDEAGEPFAEMRPGLVKGEEFRVLPQDAWDLVCDWYGQRGPTIVRYAQETATGLDNEYEIYPPIFTLLKVPYNHTANTHAKRDQPPKRMLASRKTLFQTWLKDAKQLVGVPMTTKVRPWKILGGLKNPDTSGMLTPIASRGSSPAPGAELVVQTGGRMLLDVNTFTSLRDGDQRELVSAKDQTANENYNGRSDTLEKEGLSRNEVIVLEEQGTAEKWASDKAPFKTVVGKAKSHLSPGTTLQGPMTRGRGRSSRTRGRTGLSNLGNTCYMNSALQCIRSVEELTEYFLQGYWKKDLNPSNPLGHQGNIARAYAELLKKIYDGDSTSFSPSSFKSTIGRYGHSFAGYGQQDSQEFLLFLLDGLQEDLNRILKKPYIEKPDSTDDMVHDQAALKAFADRNWTDYKKRNDSVVTDLFAGMYKSTVTCPVCDKVSIIFDPFSNLTLQLPIATMWAKEVIFFGLHKPPVKIDVEVDKFAPVSDIKKFVQKKTGVPVERLVMAESYKSRFYRIFSNYTVISEAGIQKADVIVLHELDSVPTDYNPNKVLRKNNSIFSRRDSAEEIVDISSAAADRLLVPVFHRHPKNGSRSAHQRELFGEPAFVVIGREDAKSYDRVLQIMLGVVMTMTTLDILQDDSLISVSPEGSDTVVMNDDGQSSETSNVHDASVQGEDGLVDVSMKEAPTTGDVSMKEAPTTGDVSSSILLPGAFIPPQLTNMFSIKVVAMTDGAHTGWNDVNDTGEYAPASQRQSTGLAHRPLSVVNGTSESASSDDDSPDIPHGPATPEDSSGSGAQSAELSDDDMLPEVSTLVHQSRAVRTYSRRERRRQDRSAKQKSNTPLVRPGDAIVLDWGSGAFDALFTGEVEEKRDMRGSATWIHNDMDTIQDAELMDLRQKRQVRKKHGISLEECLDEFGKSETLSENNAWYCPRCKEHRRADKRFELWKVPDILIMHLKRFSSNRNFRDKLDVHVDYPIDGLDMTSRVIDNENGKSLVYDLIAVDNHYGGLGGGHYTACAKNFYDDVWQEYNDTHVSSRADPRVIVTNAAYLLFYRRRSDPKHPLGGKLLHHLLENAHETEADFETQSASREPSPGSGEGRRLDGSSHNGSSSAGETGQAHRVGEGGLPLTRSFLSQSQGASQQEGALPSYYEATDNGSNYFDPNGVENDWNSVPNPWDALRVGNSFSKMTSTSDSSDHGDGSSTKVEGAGAGSPSSLHQRLTDDCSDNEFVDSMEFGGGRSRRESAPPPDDDEEDLPVQQLNVP